VPGYNEIPGNETANSLAMEMIAKNPIVPEHFCGILGSPVCSMWKAWLEVEHSDFWMSHVSLRHCKGCLKDPLKKIQPKF
jgi:hypothetical protein